MNRLPPFRLPPAPKRTVAAVTQSPAPKAAAPVVHRVPRLPPRSQPKSVAPTPSPAAQTVARAPLSSRAPAPPPRRTTLPPPERVVELPPEDPNGPRVSGLMQSIVPTFAEIMEIEREKLANLAFRFPEAYRELMAIQDDKPRIEAWINENCPPAPDRNRYGEAQDIATAKLLREKERKLSIPHYDEDEDYYELDFDLDRLSAQHRRIRLRLEGLQPHEEHLRADLQNALQGRFPWHEKPEQPRKPEQPWKPRRRPEFLDDDDDS